MVNCPLNLLYPLECKHEHRQMPTETPMKNIQKNKENEKLTVIWSNEHKSKDKDDSKNNFRRPTRKTSQE